MDIQLIGLLAFAFGLSAFRNLRFAFFAFTISSLLGSSAAAILTFMGGANVQPAHLMLGFLTLGLMTQARRREKFEMPREGVWLSLAVGYGVLGAFFLPRLFAGETYINAIGVTEFGFASIPIPLGPTSGNITQSVYFVGNLVCFLVSYAFARSPGNIRVACNAYMTYCVLNVGFALVDLATYATGTAFLLDFIRNATYTLHLDTEIDGLKRIVGSFTETSSFSYASIACLGFMGRLWLGGVAPALTLTISLATIALLILSTSTTAYVALPIMLCFLLMTGGFRLLNSKTNATTLLFVVMTPLLAILALTTILLIPSVSDALYNFIDMSILRKGTSASGIERTQWNVFAFQNFIETYGLGAGVGSVRASSFVIAVLANLGVIGGGAYLMFIILVVSGQKAPRETYNGAVQAAAQTACVGMLIAATISGALIDLGLTFFILAGLATAVNETAGARTVARRRPPQAVVDYTPQATA